MFHTQVDEHSKTAGGQQQVVTLEGYTVPISINSGTVYIHPVCVPSDHDVPHVVFTSPQQWDLTVLNHKISLELLPAPDSAIDQSLLQESTFDEFGELKGCVVMLLNIFLDASTQACHKQAQQLALINWASLCPYFGFQSEEVIKATYLVTSQYAVMAPTNDNLKKHFKTHSPVFNIPHHNEPIMIDDGSSMVICFCGHDTLVCDVYGFKTLKQFCQHFL